MAKAAHRTTPRLLDGRIVIIGGGIAGLFTALKLVPMPVTLVCADALDASRSGHWIEDGSIAGTDADAHARDTIATGCGLVDETVAHLVARDAADRIADLRKFGALASHGPENQAGADTLGALIAHVAGTPSIEVLGGYVAEELIKTGAAVTGAILSRTDDPAARFRVEGAAAVVLATGGAGGLFEVTTNSPHSLGQAIALAAGAGAVIADVEFVTFQPAATGSGAEPAAHFHIGGVKTDIDGRTLVPGLWAVGEAAATGLHGADSLASNAALEAVVFGARTALALAALDVRPGTTTLTRVRADHLPDSAARATAIKVIRATLTRHAGAVRSAAGLTTALSTLQIIAAGADGDRVIENAVITARFIVEAALRRKESRGSHTRSDFPVSVAALARRSSITAAGLSLRETAAQHMAAVAAAAAGKTLH